MIIFVLSFFSLSFAACVRNESVEERTGDTDVLIIEPDESLLQVNSFNSIRLAEGVQGVLYDDVAKVIYYKQNGTVHSSNSSSHDNQTTHAPCIHQHVHINFEATVPIAIVILNGLVYLALIGAIIIRKYTPMNCVYRKEKSKLSQSESPVYRSLTTINTCKA